MDEDELKARVNILLNDPEIVDGILGGYQDGINGNTISLEELRELFPNV